MRSNYRASQQAIQAKASACTDYLTRTVSTGLRITEPRRNVVDRAVALGVVVTALAQSVAAGVGLAIDYRHGELSELELGQFDLVTALEVVDAQNTHVQARNMADEAGARYRVALADLQTLTGSF